MNRLASTGRRPLMGWSGRLPPQQQAMLVRGTKDKERAMAEALKNSIAFVGIDIGKNSFHVVGLDECGCDCAAAEVVPWPVESRLANLPPCLIDMEACVGAHHLSRKLQRLGHDARPMPARYVRPYSKGQKNDFRDAEAIAEAVQRPTMKFVATNTTDQLDLQALHGVRDRLVGQRTASSIRSVRSCWSGGIAVRQGLRFPAVRVAGYSRDAHRFALASHAAHHRGSGGRLAPAG
jgi:transposase